MYEPSQNEPQERVQCQTCGETNETLRYSAHPIVTSTLIAANETLRVGMWCAECRAKQSASAIARTLITGWWSLRGPVATVTAIRTNLAGGQQVPSSNAQMLRSIARFKYDLRDYAGAAKFARAAESVQPQRDTRQLLQTLNAAGHHGASSATPWRFAPAATLAAVSLLLVALVAAVLPEGSAEAPAQVAEMSVVPAADEREAPAEAPAEAPPQRRTLKMSDMKVVANGTAMGNKVPSSFPDLAAAADRLETQLASDPGAARRYIETRMSVLSADLRRRVIRGDEITSIASTVRALGSKPALASILSRPGPAAAYEELRDVMDACTRYYRPGAHVDVIERTAGESLDSMISMSSARMLEDSSATREVISRAGGVIEMDTELQIRGAVIYAAQGAMQAFAESVK